MKPNLVKMKIKMAALSLLRRGLLRKEKCYCLIAVDSSQDS